MENKEKGMFTGFSKVFKFTAAQNIKGKGFKTSTILLGLVFAVIFAAINIIMAVTQTDDEKSGDINKAIGVGENIKAEIFCVNKSSVDNHIIEGILQAEIMKESKITFIDENEYRDAINNVNTFLEGKENSVVAEFSEDDKTVRIKLHALNTEENTNETADLLGSVFVDYLDFVRLTNDIGLEGYELEVYNAKTTFSQAVKLGEEPEDIGVMLAKIFIPIIFSFTLYMMVMVHGQSITKVVVSEKSSKLMEMLLTSVKPYAIISGKVIAVSLIAIAQMVIWAIFGIAGYVAGEKIAEAINPGYTNILGNIIEVIGNSASAFSIEALLVAVIMTITGFLMYSVFAGLVAAMVDKTEDISTATSIYQLPLVLGFFLAYFGSLFGNEMIQTISGYCPISAVFSIPADVLLGNISISGAVISLGLVIITTFGCILLTGKIYKGKLFNKH